MKIIIIAICVMLTAVLVFMCLNPNLAFFRFNIFGWGKYHITWVDGPNNFQFYSCGYAGQYYCGIIYPYKNSEKLNEIRILSKRKVEINGREINVPEGDNIVLMKADMSVKFLSMPDIYFIRSQSGRIVTLDIEKLKKDGIWDTEISPYLNQKE